MPQPVQGALRSALKQALAATSKTTSGDAAALVGTADSHDKAADDNTDADLKLTLDDDQLKETQKQAAVADSLNRWLVAHAVLVPNPIPVPAASPAATASPSIGGDLSVGVTPDAEDVDDTPSEDDSASAAVPSAADLSAATGGALLGQLAVAVPLEQKPVDTPPSTRPDNSVLAGTRAVGASPFSDARTVRTLSAWSKAGGSGAGSVSDQIVPDDVETALNPAAPGPPAKPATAPGQGLSDSGTALKGGSGLRAAYGLDLGPTNIAVAAPASAADGTRPAGANAAAAAPTPADRLQRTLDRIPVGDAAQSGASPTPPAAGATQVQPVFSKGGGRTGNSSTNAQDEAPSAATVAAFARAMARASGPDAAATSSSSSSTSSRSDRLTSVPVTSVAPITLNSAAGSTAIHAPSEAQGAAVFDDQALEQQIVQAIRLQWQGGIGEATIQLKPEHLGALTVSLKVEGSTVSADVHAETQSAQQWIAAHQADLRSGLERQGLTLERFDVNPDAEQQRRQSSSQEKQEAGARRRRRGEDPTMTFEVAA